MRRSARYAPGIEEVLFEKATWMTLTRAGIRPTGLGVTGSADVPVQRRSGAPA